MRNITERMTEEPVRWLGPADDPSRSFLEKAVNGIVRTVFGDKRIDISGSELKLSVPRFSIEVKDKDTFELLRKTKEFAQSVLFFARDGSITVNKLEAEVILNHIQSTYRANNCLKKLVMKALGYNKIVNDLSMIISMIDNRGENITANFATSPNPISFIETRKIIGDVPLIDILAGRDVNSVNAFVENFRAVVDDPKEYLYKQLENFAIGFGASAEQIKQLRSLRRQGKISDVSKFVSGNYDELIDEAIRDSGFNNEAIRCFIDYSLKDQRIVFPFTAVDAFIKKAGGEEYADALRLVFYNKVMKNANLKKEDISSQLERYINFFEDIKVMKRFLDTRPPKELIYNFIRNLSNRNDKKDILFILEAMKYLEGKSDKEGLYNLITGCYESLAEHAGSFDKYARYEKKELVKLKKVLQILARTDHLQDASLKAQFAEYVDSHMGAVEDAGDALSSLLFDQHSAAETKRLLQNIAKDPNYVVIKTQFHGKKALIRFLEQFSNIRDRPGFAELLKKAQTTLRSTEVKDNDRITLQELDSLSLAGYLYEKWQKSDLPDILHTIDQSVIDRLRSAHEFMKQFNQAISDEGHYHPGDILLYSGDLIELIESGRLPVMHRLVKNVLSDYEFNHAYQLVKGFDGKIKSSRIWGNQTIKEFEVRDLMKSKGWRLHVDALVPPELVEWMQQLYGDDWRKNLDGEFQQVLSTLHIWNLKLRYLSYDMERAVSAGLSRFKLRKGRRKYEKDFEYVHNLFLDGQGIVEGQYKKQICSEFVSKSTIAAIMQLNKQLARAIKNNPDFHTFPRIERKLVSAGITLNKDLDDYLSGVRKFGPERQVTVNAENMLRQYMKQVGYKDNLIELIIRVNNEEILDLPFDRTQKLKRIYPGRLIEILESKGCVEKLGKPAVFEKMIKS